MYMKHNLMPLQVATIAGLLLLGGVAFAQDASTGATTPAPTPMADRKAEMQNLREKAQLLKTEVKEKKAELKDQRMELKEKASTTRAEKKEKMNAEKKARLVGVVRKLSQQISNIEALLARTESRITKLAAQGGNTTASAAFVATVKTKITEAKTALEDLKAKAQAAVASETKEKMADITAGARAVEEKIKEARAALADAINSLKPGRTITKPMQFKNTTSTPRQ